jgi:tellurite resistance protein TerB
MAMFGLLKKLKAAATDFHADITKKDDMERAIYIAVSVAFADGTMEDQEREMIPKLVAQMFRNFEPGEIVAVVRRAIEDHSISAEMGFLETEHKLEGVESAREAAKLFAVARAVAGADGEIEPAEQKVIQRFASLLGLNAQQVLRAA